MRVSREQVAENRRVILEAAGRLFRERGFDAVTVAEVMSAAGLTHGGFYGYFRSKDELVAAAVAAALSSRRRPAGDLAAFADGYLSRTHRDDVAGGCAVAALAAETSRQTGAARTEMTAALRRRIERLTEFAPGGDAAARRRAAIGAWSAMVGAMILSRVSDDEALSDEVLEGTRDWLRAETAAPAGAAEKSISS